MGGRRDRAYKDLMPVLERSHVIEIGGDSLSLTDEFLDEVERWEPFVSESDSNALETRLHEVGIPEPFTETIISQRFLFPEICAEYIALSIESPLCHPDRVRLLPMFDSLRDHPPPTDGSPTAFVPVHGHRLPFHVDCFEKALVYIWLDDCPPCDTVREFLSAEADQLDELALFSVYGPDSAEELHDRYGVTGGPVVLFMLDGEIDARVPGAKTKVLATEIEKHLEL